MLHWYSLTRRFTLLRSYNGDPVALEDLKTKFAEQRARGGINQVSEEEEDMILEALGRMRFNGGTNRINNSPPPDSDPPSIDAGSAPISPAKPSKRFSNNLFGSARLRDYNYVRSTQKTGSTRNALSFTPSEASTSTKTHDQDGVLHPRTLEDTSFALSMVSNVNDSTDQDSTPVDRPAPRDNSSFYAGDGTSSGSEFRLSRQFNQEAFERASMALEEVIREIEEEAEEPDVDDDIVLLRSPSAAPDSEEPPSSHEEGSESVSCLLAPPSPDPKGSF
jgi:serine/arginine repetitive matrix protein 2